MCTAVSFKTRNHYFGRNLDLECGFQESVVITPRHYPFVFRRMSAMKKHFALIGMASVVNDYPLYYEATNEHGLSMAGLNFPKNAFYPPEEAGRDNVSPFELIPYILGQCENVIQAKALLARTHIAAIHFSDALRLSPLHWMIADREASIVVESMLDGLHIHDNPVGVMTNNPPFDFHMTNLSQYTALSPGQPKSLFGSVELTLPSRGMGSLGLPGDLSSPSRFIRAAFTKAYSICGEDEASSVSQFFHILGSVRHVRGSVMVGDRPEITLYACCCNTDKGVYYYQTYENSRICAVDMRKEDLDSASLIRYPLQRSQDFCNQN